MNFRIRTWQCHALLVAGIFWILGIEISALVPGHPLGAVFGGWPTTVVQFIAAGMCALGAMRQSGRSRTGMLLIAAGIAAWTLGDLYWVTFLDDRAVVPIPSLADALYLALIPLVLAGLILLVRSEMTGVSRTVIADAVIVQLATATIGAAFVLVPVASQSSGGLLEAGTNLAYPVSDLMLLGVVVSAAGLRDWRLNARWGLLAAAIFAFFIADSAYLVGTANGTYVSPSPYDVGWTGSTLLFAAAAWMPRQRYARKDVSGSHEIVVPLGLAFIALVVALMQPPHGAHTATIILGAACMAAVMARLVLTFRSNQVMLRASRAQANTDPLTQLPNRRALAIDLQHAIAAAATGSPAALAIFDLDGFKHYNDTFGHPSGDALLIRLARRLEPVLEGHGKAYRIGGDEFCALVQAGAGDATEVLAAAAQALADRGDGFQIGCSFGTVMLPHDAADATAALQLADQRMYTAKRDSRQWAGAQITEVLSQALRERDAELGSHVDDVADLAHAVAVRLRLPELDRERIRSAAVLHDIGKVAIPDAILNKPGPLDDEEWEFVRRHTIIGERIVGAASSLDGVGSLIRSSHENFDGSGYPDSLAGDDIPLGSRIVAVCDAFDAMRSNRSYQSARAADEAIAELLRCSGTQFDPAVVEAFCAVWAASTPLSPVPAL